MVKVKRAIWYVFLVLALSLLGSCSNVAKVNIEPKDKYEISEVEDNLTNDGQTLADVETVDNNSSNTDSSDDDLVNTVGKESSSNDESDIENKKTDIDKSSNTESDMKNSEKKSDTANLSVEDKSEVKANNNPTSESENKSEEVGKDTKTEETKELSAEEVKIADKVKALTLVGKRLTKDQISELMSMAKGGFTAEEKAKAKELFYSNFTDEEREWILKMYEKYY